MTKFNLNESLAENLVQKSKKSKKKKAPVTLSVPYTLTTVEENVSRDNSLKNLLEDAGSLASKNQMTDVLSGAKLIKDDQDTNENLSTLNSQEADFLQLAKESNALKTSLPKSTAKISDLITDTVFLDNENNKQTNKNEQKEDVSVTLTDDKLSESASKPNEANENIKDYTEITDVFDLIDNLQKIESKHDKLSDYDYYKDQIAKVPTEEQIEYERLPEVVIDEEQIKQDAIKEVESDIEKKKESAINKANLDIKERLENIKNLQENTNIQKSEIEDAYDNARITAENDALRRGLARSSIVLKTLDGIEENRADALVKVSLNYQQKLQTLESEINSLNTELQDALQSFDLLKAVNVTEAVEEKIAELKEKQQEVLEFNNKVKQMELAQAEKINKLKADAETQKNALAKEYEGIAERERQSELVGLVRNYLNTLSKKEAIEILTYPGEIDDILGERFAEIYYEQMRRKV